MGRLSVAFKGGRALEVQAGQHRLICDVSQEHGGQDSGMTPTEAFMGSLGACVGLYVARYCENARLDARDMNIQVSWQVAEDKKRYSVIEIALSLPHAELGKREPAVLEVGRHCFLHRTIEGHPDIRIALEKG